MTSAQLVQFVCMLGQSTVMLVGGAACSNVPTRVVGAYNVYILSLFVLFLHFYVQSYSGKAASAAKKQA